MVRESLLPACAFRRSSILRLPRDQDELKHAGVASIDHKIRVIRASELASDPAETVREAADAFAASRPWWLHTDLDVLSTESLPAVDYRQPGGLTWDQLTEVTRAALVIPGVAGWTVTIYNPDLDPGLEYARRIVAYITSSL